MPSIRLIVGLGNPGEKYIGTRHNAGADFVSALAKQNGIEPEVLWRGTICV